ncbi:MAG: lipid A biosynthesis acyltransferase [Deltaproteobacteria bacterium]|nr:lipid A biosynthesis acyltransferase [Deltaproteobacteria bacterium]
MTPGTATPAKPEWASASERGSRFILRVVVWLIRRLGGAPLRPLLAPIAVYYTVFAHSARRASRAFLARIDRARGDAAGKPGLIRTYRHFYSFAEGILDRLSLWSGAYHKFEVVLHGRETMAKLIEDGRGAFMVGAHLGNFDMLRLIARENDIPVNVLMLASNASRINEAFEALDPECSVRVIDIGTESTNTALEIRRCVERGEFVAVLADRILPQARNRIARANFLGEPATFPEGPFLLPMVMQLPVVMTIALKTGPKRYEVFMEEIAGAEPVPAAERAKVIQERVEKFAARLEHHCVREPLQWFNFYDFWAEIEDAHG